MFSLYLFHILLGCLTLSLCRLWYQRVTTSIAHRNLIQKYGCKQPAAMSRKDPFFGLDLIRDAVHAAETKTSIRRQVSLYAQYGNTFSARFLMTPVINTIEQENITTILTNKFDDYGIGSRRKEAFAPLLGQSIFQVDGLEWQHSRDLVRLCLSKVEMDNLPRLDVHVDNLVGAILRDGAMVDLGELFPRLTADITTDYMFGKSLMSLRDPSSLRNSFMEAIHESQAGCEKRWLMGPFARVIPQRSFYKNVEKVHKFMDQLIDEAQQLRKPPISNSEPGEERQKRHSVVDELQHLIGSRKLLRDELLTMFFAGVDTAAALLTNLFFTLGKRPDIWRKLRHEVEPLQGERPTNAQLTSLTYHRYCLKESLRIHPVLPSNSRIAYKDTVLPRGGGVDQQSPIFVPKGTMVAFGIAALHRRKDLWGEDADDFRPERWVHEKSSSKFIPFNSRPRNCIGQAFAMTLTEYVLVRLVQAFRSVESRDDNDWVEGMHMACTSANGAKVVMRATRAVQESQVMQ